MDTLGKHLILDLWNVKKNVTFNKNLVDDLIYILKDLNQTVLDWAIHEFKNDAYTLIFLLGESHLSIHTWPESKYVALDFYTCNSSTDMKKAYDKFNEFFQPCINYVCGPLKRGEGIEEGMHHSVIITNILAEYK